SSPVIPPVAACDVASCKRCAASGFAIDTATVLGDTAARSGGRGTDMRFFLVAALAAVLTRFAPAQVIPVTAHDGTVFPAAARAARGGFDQNFHLGDLAPGGPLPPPRAHAAPLTALAGSPDGTMLVSGDSDGGLQIWRPEHSLAPQHLAGHPACVYAIAF